MATEKDGRVIYAAGDWVRFYQNGKLVIGEVKYIRERTLRTELCTDAGSVDTDSVLEVRSATKPTE